MGNNRFLLILIFSTIGLISPLSVVNAVNTQKGRQEKVEIKKDVKKGKKMDALSLVAHIAVSTGLASFFFLPMVGLILLPAGFIMGLIAWAGGKRRYERKRGRGLALAAMILGGAFVLGILASLTFFIWIY